MNYEDLCDDTPFVGDVCDLEPFVGDLCDICDPYVMFVLYVDKCEL